MSDHVLHLADCLDPEHGLSSLPDKSVDALITDPPYEAEAHTKGRRIKAGKGTRRGVRSAPLPFAAITPEARGAAAREFTRVCRGWALVFGQVEALPLWRASMEEAGARYIRTGIYVKSNPQPQLTGDRPGVGYEAFFIFWLGRPADIAWNGGGRCAVYYATSEWGHGRLAPHPTTKPLELMEQLVRDFTQAGDLILDAYAGSGTTLVAAKRLGRRALGWEISPEYHAKAVARVDAAREQFGLRLAAPAPAPKQVELLGAATGTEG